MDNIWLFGVRIDRLFQNLEKALHIFASTSWTYMTAHKSMNTYIYSQLALGPGCPCKKSTNIGSKNKQQTNMDVSENSGFSPQIIHFNRVFHYFHQPFWGAPFGLGLSSIGSLAMALRSRCRTLCASSGPSHDSAQRKIAIHAFVGA